MEKASRDEQNKKSKTLYPVIVIGMCLGVFCIGFSVGLMRIAHFGTDPFSCMNLGLKSFLPISYGTCQLLVNIILLLIMLLTFRKSIGLGTLVNMAGCGYAADFTVWVLGMFHITAESMNGNIVLRLLFMFAGVLLLGFGAALYMQCDIGIAPYDALGSIIEHTTHGKVKFQWARIGTDVTCVAIGFFAGSVVGIATVVTAFFTGPLVTFFRNILGKMRIFSVVQNEME